MDLKKRFFIFYLLFAITWLHAQQYRKGKLIYADGEQRTTFINKKINGTSIKIKNVEGEVRKIPSKELKEILLFSSKNEKEARYEYVFVVDHKGKESKKPQWLNKIIDGQMSLYKENFLYAGNPAGSGSSWYLKRKNEKQALLLSPLRMKKQLSEYFKDNPQLAEKIRSGEIYDPREMVGIYNRAD